MKEHFPVSLAKCLAGILRLAAGGRLHVPGWLLAGPHTSSDCCIPSCDGMGSGAAALSPTKRLPIQQLGNNQGRTDLDSKARIK